MWVILIWIIIGFFTAMVAKSKGQNVGLWLILGLFFGIFALIAVALVQDKTKAVASSTNYDATLGAGRPRGPSIRPNATLKRSELETLQKVVEGSPVTDEEAFSNLEKMGYVQTWPKLSLTTKGRRAAEEHGVISKPQNN